MSDDNRKNERYPLQLVVRELTDDNSGPRQHLAVDVSETGIRLNRLADAPEVATGQGRPSGRRVQLELEVPGRDEVIWARGEVMYDRFDSYFHQSGVRFDGMAAYHRRILRDLIDRERARRLRAAIRAARARRAPAKPPLVSDPN